MLIQIAINLLWFALGVLIIGAIIYVVLWAIKQFFPVPPVVERVIWAAGIILILIALLSTVQGGGAGFGHFRFGSGAITGAAIAVNSTGTAAYL